MPRKIRKMIEHDWYDVGRIYQDGIETGMATFQRNHPPWEDWNASHLDDCRLVITQNGLAAGWAAFSPYRDAAYTPASPKSAYTSTKTTADKESADSCCMNWSVSRRKKASGHSSPSYFRRTPAA